MRISILFLLLAPLFIQAQTQSWTIHMGYDAEFMTRPGFHLGADYPILQKEKVKLQTRHYKQSNHQWIIGSGLQWYQHQKHHSGLFIGVLSGYRFERIRQEAKGRKRVFRTDIQFGLGVYRYFLDGTTYSFNNGDISGQSNGGRMVMMPITSWKIGAQFPNKKNIPIHWYIRSSLLLETQHNHQVLPKPFLGIGLSYRLGH